MVSVVSTVFFACINCFLCHCTVQITSNCARYGIYCTVVRGMAFIVLSAPFDTPTHRATNVNTVQYVLYNIHTVFPHFIAFGHLRIYTTFVGKQKRKHEHNAKETHYQHKLQLGPLTLYIIIASRTRRIFYRVHHRACVY